jgi:hypothetical protein
MAHLTKISDLSSNVYTQLNSKQPTLTPLTNLVGMGNNITTLDYNKITSNKPTKFQSDWDSTPFGSPIRPRFAPASWARQVGGQAFCMAILSYLTRMAGLAGGLQGPQRAALRLGGRPPRGEPPRAPPSLLGWAGSCADLTGWTGLTDLTGLTGLAGWTGLAGLTGEAGVTKERSDERAAPRRGVKPRPSGDQAAVKTGVGRATGPVVEGRSKTRSTRVGGQALRWSKGRPGSSHCEVKQRSKTNTPSERGQTAVEPRPNRRPNRGQTAAKPWSNRGQTAAEPGSNRGPTRGRAGGGGAAGARGGQGPGGREGPARLA